jgi:ubiquinol-cytochrome c reductase cytochrome b subunit
MEANPLVTPIHIQPEWYFLPYYAILRSIPLKIHGIILMLLSILILFCMPTWHEFLFNKKKEKTISVSFLNKIYLNSSFYNVLFIYIFFFWVLNVCILTFIGSSVITHVSIDLGILCTIIYFLFFVLFIPLTNFLKIFIFLKFNKFN